MGFLMDGLDAESYDRVYSDRALVTRIAGYFRPLGRIMLAVAGLIVLNSLMDTALPLLLARGVDTLAQPGGPLDQATRTMAELSWAASRLAGDTLPRINNLATEGARAATTVERAARAVGDSPRSVLFGNTPQPGPGEPGFPGFGATPAPRGTR